jgi:hypothetical protein
MIQRWSVGAIWVLVALCVVHTTAFAKPKDKKKPRDSRPGWAQDNDCVRKDEGGAGDKPEVLEAEPRKGLHFDEGRPPEHGTMLPEPEIVLFKVAAINELPEPMGAWVEVSVCGFQEACVTAGGDYRLFGKRGRIEPGESRFVVFETAEKLGYGTHRVTFALFDENGKVSDWWLGEPITVGNSDVRVDEILYPGSDQPRAPVGQIKPEEPVVFSVVVSNAGNAPEAVVAIFAIDGGGEFTCGVELYSEPTRVEAGQQSLVISKAWDKPTPGRHILSVILKDQRGRVLYENHGVPFELK